MSAPYIPATALGGDLVRDWTGPTDEWVPPGATSFSGRWAPSVVLDGHPYPDRYRVQVRLRLDPRREEVATRIATVLRVKGHEVGHLLPVALGGRQGDVIAEEQDRADDPCSAHAVGAGELCSLSRPCPVARGTPQRTIRRAIPAADVSALTLTASVSGVEAGRGVVRGVLGEWHTLDVTNCRLSCETYAGRTCYWTMDEATRNECRGPREIAPTFAGEHDGWCWGDLYGPETGQAAIARIYAAVHAAGWARLDPTAPFGVVVPFLNLENER